MQIGQLSIPLGVQGRLRVNGPLKHPKKAQSAFRMQSWVAPGIGLNLIQSYYDLGAPIK